MSDYFIDIPRSHDLEKVANQTGQNVEQEVSIFTPK